MIGRRRKVAASSVPSGAGARSGEKSEDLADELGLEYDDWPTSGLAGSSAVRAFSSRAATLALWGLLAGAVLLSLLQLGTSGTAAAPAPGVTQSAVPVAPPSGCAELTVSAWLNGDEKQLKTLVQGGGAGNLKPGLRHAARTYLVAAVPGGREGVWGFTVAAEVLVAVEKSWRSAGEQYFQVTMARATGGCEGWVAVGLPAQVAGPTGASSVPSGYPHAVTMSDSPLLETLNRFFTALLTNVDGVDRYLSPGAVVRPIRPAPYTKARVDEVRTSDEALSREPNHTAPDGAQVHLLVEVEATVNDQPVPLAYPVVVQMRDGRWEVAALEPTTAVGAPENPEPTASPLAPSPSGTTPGGSAPGSQPAPTASTTTTAVPTTPSSSASPKQSSRNGE